MPIPAMQTLIELPQPTLRPRGLFTQVATSLSIVDDGTDRTLLGAKFMARGAFVPQIETFDCDEPTDWDVGTLARQQAETNAFAFWNAIECSTLSREENFLAELVRMDADLVRSMAFATVATSSVDPDVLNLVEDSTSLGTYDTVSEALSAIEEGLSDRIGNTVGTVLVHPARLARAVVSGSVRVEGDELRTPTGHRVIADAGHFDPDQVFGTGVIGYSSVEADLVGGELGQLDRERNILRWMAQSFGVLVFNPLHSVRAGVVAAPGGVS